MNKTPITLSQTLEARDRRAQLQRQLLEQWGKTLICFTMNIAGPVKIGQMICRGFETGLRALQAQLKAERIPIVHMQYDTPVTGCEAYLLVDAPAHRVKALTAALEDSSPLGRLFDMDVFAADGERWDRDRLGLPPRKCLICDRPAHYCSRSRAHDLKVLQEKTASILRRAIRQEDSEHIARLAVQSLLWEVCTTPKPGLVDCQNNGAHTDMDIFTFCAAASALWPYFAQCAATGMETQDLAPEETLQKLRTHGRLAEASMYDATGGVNTHKGAIFSLGIVCGALGRLDVQNRRSPEAVSQMCAAMARDVAGQMPSSGAATQGERIYTTYGVTGARGQAEAGFADALAALAVLENGLAQGLSFNDSGCAALLKLMATTDDTNLIARGGRETQLALQKGLQALLLKHPYPDRETLQTLDKEFIRYKLSPGGCADLLAVAYMLHLVKHQ